ncbi:MAG: thermonuclease family protein [Tardiphaga sp.]|nr:thermonuclease family protein [Tardiphaga sp.]
MAASGRREVVTLLAITFIAASIEAAQAGGCWFEPQGEGRVAAIIDARTFRLGDGREVRLAGIEVTSTSAADTAVLARLIAGQDVTLHGDDDGPDRYGRQPAFVFLKDGRGSVQVQLLTQGAALSAGSVAETGCAVELSDAEARARRDRIGVWAKPMVIKNAESPGDILSEIGRFAVVEGRVRSVRQTGATSYINFGRNWTQDFAVTISRRVVGALEAAGVALPSLERRRIRVRGWVDRHGGPRIEVLRVGQLEVVGGN